jgi:hypothetical protein
VASPASRASGAPVHLDPCRPDVGRRTMSISSKEHVMERKELAFFIAIGGLVLVTIVVVVSRFV